MCRRNHALDGGGHWCHLANTAYLGSPEKGPLNVCVCVCVCVVYETSSLVAAALIDYYFTYVLRGVCGAITERNIAMRRMNSRNASRYCVAALK